MKYTVQPDETVSEGIKRIVDGKVEDALRQIDDEPDRHEAVHGVRKRCKEIRAALRLVREVLPSYDAENAHYRDAARRLSDIRDAQALIETFDARVVPAITERDALDEDTLERIRATLVDRRESMAAEQDIEARLAAVRRDLIDGRERVRDLPIATDGFDAVAGGLRKSYKRARNRMDDAYEDPISERYHEWRKRVKYHRYHCRLLRSAWTGPMKARRSELKTLSDLLGDEHDLAVFAETMSAEELFDTETRKTLARIITGKRSELQREARPIGERLFAEEPDQFVDRMRQYWDTTRRYES